jgi:copper chaperone CopZ
MTKKLLIDGMSCKHCASAVEAALTAVPGVVKVKVKLKHNLALVKLDTPVTDALFSTAISGAGYEFKGVTT